jgi:hypothetical protein
MTRKAIYKHKTSGDLFAIETDNQGNVVSTSGPLLVKDLNANELDYDNYWDEDTTVGMRNNHIVKEYRKRP